MRWGLTKALGGCMVGDEDSEKRPGMVVMIVY